MNQNIIFNITSDLNDYNQDTIVTNIYEIGHINIDCKIENMFTLNMNTELTRINSDEVQNFITNIQQNIDGQISFNDGDHSFIGVKENILYFSVFTWKEGAFTDLNFSFQINENIKTSLLEMLNRLLQTVELYQILADRFYRMENEEENENYSDSENPEDEDSENENPNNN
jgi:hypothetical protein